MKGFIKELFITLGLALAVFLLLQTTIQSSIVDGRSMEPGLEDSQRLIVVKAVYNFKSPERGDIIIIHPPVSPQNQWVKRVIGLPGDTVEVKNGTVYVNDTPLDEPYIKESPEYILAPYQVPEDNYFVLGDNRNASSDSHRKWTVSRKDIVGEVWLRIWPLSEWGIVHGYPLDEELQADN
ncbi:MAG: signal peptidase I [Dehalococcoidales bacterium]|nr:signal peptidase I [Dehalococcoidales bacterium]